MEKPGEKGMERAGSRELLDGVITRVTSPGDSPRLLLPPSRAGILPHGWCGIIDMRNQSPKFPIPFCLSTAHARLDAAPGRPWRPTRVHHLSRVDETREQVRSMPTRIVLNGKGHQDERRVVWAMAVRAVAAERWWRWQAGYQVGACFRSRRGTSPCPMSRTWRMCQLGRAYFSSPICSKRPLRTW